jgi:hypothetical protein
MINKISVSHGPWRVALPNGLEGFHEIIADDDTSIGMAHEFHDAVLMASAKEMFDALVDIHGLLMDVEDSPIKEAIDGRISIACEKIVAEADV